jgi:Protein of unknown function (DUF2510)
MLFGAFRPKGQGWAQVRYGLIIFAIGLAITVFTYSRASRGGGSYLISWGPMLIGFVSVVRGLATVIGARRAQAPLGSAFQPGGIGQQPYGGQGQPWMAAPPPAPRPQASGVPVTGTPEGWYPDPVNASDERWWDGRAWSPATRPAGAP